jgi:acetyl-CoA acetyltransferase
MITDKVAASIEAQAAAASAIASGKKDTVVAGKVLRVFKRRVRANKRRLSRR